MKSKIERMHTLIDINEELENYFSNTIIPQLYVDANLVLRKFTTPAMKHFSLKQDFAGLPLKNIANHFKYPAIISNIKAVIERGKIFEKEIQTTDKRWYQLNILPYFLRKENRTDGAIITFVDISNIKAQEELIAVHKLSLDTIAHDLKNPILGISLSLQLLKQQADKNDKKYSENLNNVEKGLMQLKTVINDLTKSR